MTFAAYPLRVADAVLNLARRPEGFDPLELLYDLTASAVDLLPIRSAGVTMLDDTGHVAYLTASDEMCRALEEDQLDLDQGPCLDSARTQQPLPPCGLCHGVGS
ncbi:hypothetical protein [Streptomyces olivaceiscleroticus]